MEEQITVTMVLTAEGYNRLLALQERVKAETALELIQLSVSVVERVLDCQEAKGSVYLVGSNQSGFLMPDLSDRKAWHRDKRTPILRVVENDDSTSDH